MWITLRLWELPAPVRGDVERIELWAQLVTGMKLDADGVIQVLDSDTWHRLRQRLDELADLRRGDLVACCARPPRPSTFPPKGSVPK